MYSTATVAANECRTKNTAIERARKASEGECWYGWWLANVGAKDYAG